MDSRAGSVDWVRSTVFNDLTICHAKFDVPRNRLKNFNWRVRNIHYSVLTPWGRYHNRFGLLRAGEKVGKVVGKVGKEKVGKFVVVDRISEQRAQLYNDKPHYPPCAVHSQVVGVPVAPGGGTGPTVSVPSFVGRVPPTRRWFRSNRKLRDAPRLVCRWGVVRVVIVIGPIGWDTFFHPYSPKKPFNNL